MAASQVGEAGTCWPGHPRLEVGMGVEQLGGGVPAMPLGFGPDAQPGDEPGVADKDVRSALGLQGGQGRGAHRVAARALANSAAKVSDDRCTYAAVDSGEAWPISSRNTNRSMPAVANSVP